MNATTQFNIDPRAYSEERLVPPEPLPYVSRKALRRVKDPIPRPSHCRYCGPDTRVELVSNSEIYGREYGDWPYAYKCEHCDSYIGVHPNTDIPLGLLADADLRNARKKYKPLFMDLQKKRRWSRKEAYHWLAAKMGIPVSHCHWGWFEKNQCEEAGEICAKELGLK